MFLVAGCGSSDNEVISPSPITVKPLVPINDKFFVIAVPTFNNEKLCKKNIESILKQDYSNYKVIIIDDVSTDETYDRIHQYLETHPLKDKVVLHRNTENQGQVANTAWVVYNHSKESDIIVTVDGDDWLLDNQVLKRLNQYYANKDVWLTYGSRIDFYRDGKQIKEGEPMSVEVLKEGSVRKNKWLASHLRTFYSSLFRQIKKEDLLLDGQNPKVTGDMFFMFPMVEMAGAHAYFVPEALYGYNMTGTHHDCFTVPEKQRHVEELLRAKTPYLPLPLLPGQFEKNTYLVIRPEGGLANRLHGIASAYVLAKQTNRKLILDWRQEDVFQADFSDLFNSIFPRLNDLFEQTDVTPESLENLDVENPDFESQIDEGKNYFIVTWVNFIQKSIRFEDFLVKYRGFYDSLELKPHTNTFLSEFALRNNFENGKVVGVHIRSWNQSNDGARSSIGDPNNTMSEVIRLMQKEIEADSTVRFFVATDNVGLTRRLVAQFGPERIMSYSEQEVRRSTLEDLERCLVEFKLLTKTNHILGTYQSSFSDEAALLTKTGRKLNFGPVLVDGLHTNICFDTKGFPFPLHRLAQGSRC